MSAERDAELERILETDPRRELERILELAAGARAALADEHEGDFRRAVVELHTRAATLLHLVAVW